MRGSARRRTPGSNGRLAALAEHAAAPDRRMGPAALWRRDAPAEQRLADLENTLRLIGLDPAEYAPLLAPLVDIPSARGARGEIRAGGIAAPATGGDDGLGFWRARDRSRSCSPSRTCTGPTRLRSISCGRSPSAARRRRCSSWRRPGRSSARPGACARTTASFRSRRSIARRSRRMVGEIAARHALSDERDRRGQRAHRRRAAVRRGGDAPASRARRAGRRAGHPADLAAVACRAPRPAGRRARGRADRRGSWTRFRLCAAARRRRHR